MTSSKFGKNYYNSRGILRPNKFVKINEIDQEMKKLGKNIFSHLL